MYHNRNNKEKKRLSSIFLEIKVYHLEETAMPLWLNGSLVPSTGIENQIAQLELENVENDIQGAN